MGGGRLAGNTLTHSRFGKAYYTAHRLKVQYCCSFDTTVRCLRPAKVEPYGSYSLCVFVF